MKKINLIIKDMFDRILAFMMLIILSPIFLIISILIKFDSKGDILFKQERLGKNGLVFEIYKFRTMCDNAINTGSGIYTFENDPRITKIGNFLRKTSLDEIPQLINILKGEMSFVGPRPPLTYHPNKYENYPDIQKRRFEVKPGLTGLAQAVGRNSFTWDQRIELDVEYVEKFNILFDIKICFMTVFSVIGKKGIYRGKENAKDKN